jgi:hypothetical protein
LYDVKEIKTMRHILHLVVFSLVLFVSAGCGDNGQSAPTPIPAAGNPTTAPTAPGSGNTSANPTNTSAAPTTAPAAGGPPIASGQAADLVVNVYQVLPYTVPAEAPPIAQLKAGEQAIILDLEVKSTKSSLLKAYVSSSHLVDAGGATFKTNAAVLGYYLSACGCKDDQAAYGKFVDGQFKPGESARTYLAYTGPQGAQGLKLRVQYVTGTYADESEAYLGKKDLVTVDLPK